MIKPNSRVLRAALFTLLVLSSLGPAQGPAATVHRGLRIPLDPAKHWLSWRGPDQTGASRETDLPSSLEGTALWTFPLAGRGTPVVADGRLFVMGYEGEGPELVEVLVAIDAASGRVVWRHEFTDYVSDIVYSRFSIGSPTIDAETGNVYCLTAGGLFSAFTSNGHLLWQRDLAAEFGRLTFPNGRTGSPLLDGELAIIHIISSAWGVNGPARDRFYAFDKRTGECAWTATPGGPPVDNSFSLPVVADEGGRRVLYTGTGCGHTVALDARTGEALWRFPMATGGINSSSLLHGDRVITVHAIENLDSSTIGRMVAMRRGTVPARGKGPVVLGANAEVWRNDCDAFSSSPVLVGDRIFITTTTGELKCVDANDGRILWAEKLAPDQIHASPVYGDGKLFVPMNNGTFYIVRPSDERGEILSTIQLAGNGLGAPAIAEGRVFVHTTASLYAFSSRTVEPERSQPAVSLQVRPADLTVRQGDEQRLRARLLDAAGVAIDEDALTSLGGAKFSGLPARGVTVDDLGVLRVAADAPLVNATVTVAVAGLESTVRLRIVPRRVFQHDFEDAALKAPASGGEAVAPPPGSWVGAGAKWLVRNVDGSQVLAKTLDNPLFQRTITYIGDPEASDYVLRADVLSDGNRRSMSFVGLINQRYLIRLKGNHQEIEVSSNMELLNVAKPFSWKPRVWYRLLTRVDRNPSGGVIVRAKAWPRDEAEPAEWTIEVPHAKGHLRGAPGIYGFTPQSRFSVYVDNIVSTPSEVRP